MRDKPDYRVYEENGMFEPQHYYATRTVWQWLPLTEGGYWADPESYSTGEITKRSWMTKDAAERAILRAKSINEENIKIVKTNEETP